MTVDDAMLVAELDATATQALETDTISIGLAQTEALLVERALRTLPRPVPLSGCPDAHA